MDASLEERLLSYLTQPHYEPQDRSAIARGMGLHSAERAPLRELITRWESEKKLLRLRGARYALAAAAHTSYTGSVHVLPRGKQLFVPHAEGQQALARLLGVEGVVRVPIPRGRSMGAMEGDIVRARVQRSAPPAYRRRKKGLRPESGADLTLAALVEEVLERRHELWIGSLGMLGKRFLVRGDGRSAPEQILLTAPPPPDALAGMLVAVQPETQPGAAGGALGHITMVLGWPDDDGVDMASVIHRYALRDTFADDVLQETLQMPTAPLPEEKSGREDWTQRCVITIDPLTARDYDDAISVRRLPDGWELAVHIADVSHYVRPGSALDAEARRRGNSTYLPDRVLPMLPPRLCDGLCSLVQGEDRLTLLCHMRLSLEGKPLHARLACAVICSRRRLTYAKALDLLERGVSTGDAEVDAMLREASHLAQLMRRRRMEAGALNLDMPELRVLLDAHGRPTGVETEESDISHQLIEEFMLAANEQVARLMRERALPTIYRVHEEPAADKWSDFAHTLREYGITASSIVSRKELVKVMESMATHPDEQQLKVALLRAMMRARYAPQPLGHFGLAKGDYCHFTSPIRRYADLIVHRGVHLLIEGAGHSRGLPHAGQMESLADHLSETERRSAAAESEALKLKLLQYLEIEASSETPTSWQAIVCGIWAHGLALDIPALQMRGYIPAALMPRSCGWFYHSGGRQWRSRSGRVLQEGATLLVVPSRVEWETLGVLFKPLADEC